MKKCDQYPEHRSAFLGFYDTALAIEAAVTPHERRPLQREECSPIFLMVRRAWVDSARCTCAIGNMTTT